MERLEWCEVALMYFVAQVQVVMWCHFGVKSLLIWFCNSDNLGDLEVVVFVDGFWS